MKVKIPFPTSDLHAHAKGNWRGKSKPTQAARQFAKFICVDMLNRKECRPISGPVLISYAIFVPDNRPRDTCNMLQSLKPSIDGIVDAGMVEGDSWQQMRLYNVSVEIDRKHPRVEITLNATNGKGDLISSVDLNTEHTQNKGNFKKHEIENRQGRRRDNCLDRR